jgi:hypothetical protein
MSEAAETAAGLRQEIGHWPHAGDGDDIYVSLALVRKAASLLDRLDAAEKMIRAAEHLRECADLSPAAPTSVAHRAFNLFDAEFKAWEALRNE